MHPINCNIPCLHPPTGASRKYVVEDMTVWSNQIGDIKTIKHIHMPRTQETIALKVTDSWWCEQKWWWWYFDFTAMIKSSLRSSVIYNPSLVLVDYIGHIDEAPVSCRWQKSFCFITCNVSKVSKVDTDAHVAYVKRGVRRCATTSWWKARSESTNPIKIPTSHSSLAGNSSRSNLLMMLHHAWMHPTMWLSVDFILRIWWISIEMPWLVNHKSLEWRLLSNIFSHWYISSWYNALTHHQLVRFVTM